MPGLNGLEFCQQLNKKAFKIILLTGEADEKIAIDMFNKGLIDRFIKKDASNFITLLSTSLSELQNEYFSEHSELIVNSLTKNLEGPHSCLDDPVFIDFFNNLCEKNQLQEYYLLDAVGSFIFVNATGKVSWLIVKDDEQMESNIYDALNNDYEVPPDIIGLIKTKQQILHRYTSEDYQINPKNWQELMYPATLLSGRANYYYSYLSNTPAYFLELPKISCFKKFFENN